MATIPIPATPEIRLVNGKPVTTSYAVSDYFGKRHDDVLKKIKTIECSSEFRLRNFAESSYLNEQNKRQPCYQFTKDGFVFLVMGFTGKKAAAFKEAYINAFNDMEQKLKAESLSPALCHSNHSVELEKAVQRKAIKLALNNIDTIAADLTAWVNLTGKDQTDQQALERLNDYHPQNAKMVFVNTGILESMAVQLSFAQVNLNLCERELRNIEKALDRPLSTTQSVNGGK